MSLVTAQLDEMSAVFTTELDLEAAVALAQDARRRTPLGHGAVSNIAALCDSRMRETTT